MWSANFGFNVSYIQYYICPNKSISLYTANVLIIVHRFDKLCMGLLTSLNVDIGHDCFKANPGLAVGAQPTGSQVHSG